MKVTVNNMTPGSITGEQTICEGDDPVAFGSVAATGDGAITYEWYMSTNRTSFSLINGATSSTYDAGALAADTWDKRTAISTIGDQFCSEESNVVKVTVNNMAPGSITGEQTICEGDDPAAFVNSASATGDGTISYQWYISTNGTSYTAIGGATGATYGAGACRTQSKV